MDAIPETRYAWNGDVALAYQLFGEGSVDLVYLQGTVLTSTSSGRAPTLRGSSAGSERVRA